MRPNSSPPQLRYNPTPAGIANHLARATNAYNLAFLIFAVIVLIVGLRLLPLGLSAYAFLLVVPPVFLGTEDIPLMGMPRYVLVAFPLFIMRRAAQKPLASRRLAHPERRFLLHIVRHVRELAFYCLKPKTLQFRLWEKVDI